jgi:hypothetical protein
MSAYDDRDPTTVGEPQYQQQQWPPYYGQLPYGPRFYGSMGFRRTREWSETKPFFMTSEFIGTLICVIGIAITAAAAKALNAQGASALIAGLVAAYTISRGIAKAGTRSRAADPRDDMSFNRSHEGQSHPHS